jgi:hypothetical protein
VIRQIRVTDRRTARAGPCLALAGFLGAVALIVIGGCSNPAPTGSAAQVTAAETSPGALQQHQATGVPDEVFFVDDFSSNASGWDLDSVQSRWLDWSFTTGKLRAARTSAAVPFAGLMRFCLPIPNLVFTDFQFSLDTISGSHTAGIGYGIFAGRAADGGRYYFELDSDGMGSVSVEEELEALRSTYIQEPISLSAAYTDGVNRLTVSAAGSVMTFYVNGTEVAYVPSAHSGSGSIGLFVEVVPGSGDETWVEFDDLIIQAP